MDKCLIKKLVFLKYLEYDRYSGLNAVVWYCNKVGKNTYFSLLALPERPISLDSNNLTSE